MTERFDIAIVGGGSAGCVLANRLSADPRVRVVLIEAGPDTPPGHQDRVLLDGYPGIAYFDTRHLWADLRVFYDPRPEAGSDLRRRRRYEQARVIGGGSSINGMMANRGAPADYDDWAAAGAAGWEWERVLPFFRKLETDLDFGGPMHGSDGPLPIRRVPRAEWPAFSVAVARALVDAGLPAIADQNDATAGFGPASFPIAVNSVDDRRVSVAAAYLSPSVRQRGNLTIWPETRVERLVVTDGRVIGAEFVCPDGARDAIQATQTILAAGAIHSPALLLRSGIGPGAELWPLGIDVVADRPGVGQNLQEHPQIAVSSHLAPAARLDPARRRHIFVGFRYSSGLADCPESDMYGCAVNRGGWHPLGSQLGGFLVWVNKAYSRGNVRLASPVSHVEPRVEMNFLDDPRDRLRLIDAFHRLAALYAHPALRAVARDPYPTSYGERSRDLAVVNRFNWLRTAPLGRLIDGSAPLRRRLYASQVSGRVRLAGLASDETALDAFVRERVHGTWHACGTCRMGSPDDPEAVTDPAGRVIGVDGLRVIDASIMPSIPRANTNVPTMMIAEKLAAAILAEG